MARVVLREACTITVSFHCLIQLGLACSIVCKTYRLRAPLGLLWQGTICHKKIALRLHCSCLLPFSRNTPACATGPTLAPDHMSQEDCKTALFLFGQFWWQCSTAWAGIHTLPISHRPTLARVLVSQEVCINMFTNQSFWVIFSHNL